MGQGSGCASCGIPGGTPAGAVPLAVLALRAPGGMRWNERVWLLRAEGQDSLWAAVEDRPDRAIPVAAAGAGGTPRSAACRLLRLYLAGTRAEVEAATSASGALTAELLAAIVASRRGAAAAQ